MPAGPLEDARLAARLCAIDPGLGGIILRGGGDLRDEVIAELRAALPDNAPVRRVPSHIDDERLLGGLDLTATLARGAAVSRAGLLAEADSGAIIVPMAERLTAAMVGKIAAVMDRGDVVVERDGLTLHSKAGFALVAFDDGIEPDERLSSALAERLAFWIDLSDVRSARMALSDPPPIVAAGIQVAEEIPESVTLDIEAIAEALVATAIALGIDSARATILALRAARASARLCGRDAIRDEDLKIAARLVLAPRATRMPAPVEQSPPESAEPEPSPDGGASEEESAEPAPIEDIVLAAALAALPKDVIARIAQGGQRSRAATRAHGTGERRKSAARGRPMGARAGTPGGGLRLSLIDTLRAAAPWQKLRGDREKIQIRRDDLRVRRFETRAETVTIFAVDASGSSALARLAEAKGAVELLLAEAYVKRAQVALVAFRGTSAALLLPPTRSLVRARRSLADLPGGGGTPLAAGLDAARELAEAARARGRTPFVVVLTDGCANIARDGRAIRAMAESDATAAARAFRAIGIDAAFIDISVRARPEGAALAAAMGARYLPLPRADAATMHAAVRRAQQG